MVLKGKTKMIVDDNKKNFAQFRKELLSLCPRMDEQEVYRNWWAYQSPHNDWKIQQEPMWGCDKKYHMVYLTKTALGEIYVGMHSTSSLDDNYHGSGDELRKLKEEGALLETTPLEFFRTRGEALAMEAHIVNRDFIIADGVLNQTPGGDDTRHNAVDNTNDFDFKPRFQPKVVQREISPLLKGSAPAYELPKEASDIIESFGTDPTPVPEVKPVHQAKATTVKSGKGTFWPFSALDVEIGDILTFAKDESITCKVLNNNCLVEYQGKAWKLTELTKHLMTGKKGKYTTLGFWKHNGKFLADVAKEKERKAA